MKLHDGVFETCASADSATPAWSAQHGVTAGRSQQVAGAATPAATPQLLLDRFWSRVDRSGDCWNWTGSVAGKGYGYLSGKRAHRIAYELQVGPIGDGMVIDHLCRNRLCCNPAHLEAVTNRTNVLRGEHPNAVTRRTGQCKRGHSMRNAKVNKSGRQCRKCIRMRDAARRATVGGAS